MDFILAGVIGGLILLAVLADRRLPRSQARQILPRTAAYLGWGPLLLVVALMNMQLWGMSLWTKSLVLLAAVVVVLIPAVATDLAAVTFMLGGLYGILLGAFWQSIIMPHRAWHNLIYGTVMVGSGPAAALAGLEGLALGCFGLWLVPRTLGRHRWAAALAGQVSGLTWIRPIQARPAAASRRPQSTRSMLIKALRGRLHEIGWGALLPVALIGLPLFSKASVAVTTVLVAAALALLLPAVAARILPVAMAVLGLYGIFIAMIWFG